LQFIRDKLQRIKKDEKEIKEVQPDLNENKTRSRNQNSDSPAQKEVLKERSKRRQGPGRRQESAVRPDDQVAAHKDGTRKRLKRWDISQFPVEAVEGKTRFHDLRLPNSIMHAIADLGFQYCTPIQAEILPETLRERDASGQAQTGTGKTAAFLIAIIYPPQDCHGIWRNGLSETEAPVQRKSGGCAGSDSRPASGFFQTESSHFRQSGNPGN
jgi:ATP-dependent RNA helicase RhlB